MSEEHHPIDHSDEKHVKSDSHPAHETAGAAATHEHHAHPEHHAHGEHHEHAEHPAPVAQAPAAGESDKKPEDSAASLLASERPSGSWGDKYKKRAFGTGTYFGLNYIVNTALSIAITYVFETRFKTKLFNAAQSMGQTISKTTGISERAAIQGSDFGLRAFFLTSGGNLLLVPIKWLEEHKNEMTYQASRILDHAQVALGQDKEGIAQKHIDDEYEKIDKYIQSVKAGNAPSQPPEDIMEIASRHCIMIKPDGSFNFVEQHKDWQELIPARAMAIGMAVGTNFALGATKGNLSDPQVIEQYGKYGKGFGQLEKAGTPVIQRIFSKIPGLRGLHERELAANITFNDAILTAISSFTHASVDSMLHARNHTGPEQPPEVIAAAANAETLKQCIAHQAPEEKEKKKESFTDRLQAQREKELVASAITGPTSTAIH